jgi:uncharacterized protein YcbX
MTTCAVVGTVLQIWRFPVKSMRAERLEHAEITDQGLVGDRAWALIDVATGKPASAKKVNDFPGLMDLSARFTEPPRAGHAPPPVVITLPDDHTCYSGTAEADQMLSDWFKREVKLTPVAQDASYLDAFPMSLVTTSSLHRFEELTPGSRFDPRRFRMNLVLETGAPGFVENGWLEHRLTIGEQATLTVTLPDSRCVMITLPQEDLPEDRDIMRTLMQHNRLDIGEATPRPCAGVYADVAAGGAIAVGDRVVLD